MTIDDFCVKMVEYKKQKIKTLKEMDYKTYLESEHWKNIREKALKRDNYRCKCGSRYRLEVHHHNYSHRGEECEINDVETICHECHEKTHREHIRTKRQKKFEEFRKAHPTHA